MAITYLKSTLLGTKRAKQTFCKLKKCLAIAIPKLKGMGKKFIYLRIYIYT